MAQKIQIKRSTTVDVPQSLEFGEVAYSFKSSKLFIGKQDKTPLDVLAGLESRVGAVETAAEEFGSALEVIDGGTF